MIVLENNYRSTQPILDVCSALIENNNERLSKRISGLEKKLISSNAELSSLSNLPISNAFCNANNVEKPQDC